MISKPLAIGLSATGALLLVMCGVSFVALTSKPDGVQRLEQLGFFVGAAGDRGIYVSAECQDPGFSDQNIPEVVSAIRSVPTIRYLSLSRTRITDAGVRELTELSQLWSLDLSNTAVSDAGVRILSEGKGLVLILQRYLDLA